MAVNNLDAFKENQEKEVIDTNRKIRVGIVGTGGIARAHMGAYLVMPDVEIVAAAELVPGRAEAFMEKFGVTGVKFYPSCDAMVADQENLKLDLVSVCTYNRQHAPCTIACLNAGINVLQEKPLCVTLEEGIEIMKAQKASGKYLSIGFQPRFDPNMQMIKKIVESGELGDVYYIQTGGGRRRGIPVGNDASFIREDTAGVGALGDIGCYSLDMVLNAIGYPKPLTVTGYKSDFFGKDEKTYLARGQSKYCAKLFGVDDFAAAFVRLEGGIILDFRISWAMNMDTPGDTIILGTKGGLRIPSTDCWNGTVGGPMTIYKEVAGEQTQVKVPILPTPNTPCNHLWYGKIRSMLDAIKKGTPVAAPIEQIIINQAILDGILRSHAEGREVTVEIPEV